jgi:hypothetical protein
MNRAAVAAAALLAERALTAQRIETLRSARACREQGELAAGSAEVDCQD